MPSPPVTHEQLIKALERFDDDFRGRGKWQGWPNIGNHRYAIFYEKKLYPVKMVLSLATGVQRRDLHGGDESNVPVQEAGLHVVPLVKQEAYSWTISGGVHASKKLDKSAFLHHGTGIPREILHFFLSQELAPKEVLLINLVFEGTTYKAEIKAIMTDTLRIQLHWKSDFEDILRTMFPGHFKAYSLDEKPTSDV